MSELFAAFKKRKALITFVTAGDPSLAVTEKLIYQMQTAGADIIELGIPFSDPLADGPVIQAAHNRALKKNVSLAEVLSLVKRARRKTSIPIVFMLSDNLIEKYGTQKFYADCEKAGVDGVIVPDLPPEESSFVPRSPRAEPRGEASSLASIYLVAPTTTDERIKHIANASSGFIYLVSVAGITGKRAKLSEEVPGLIERIRKYTQKPIAVGFGISTPAQAREAVKFADGVIVGSAIVELISRKQFKKIPKFISSLRKAIDAG